MPPANALPNRQVGSLRLQLDGVSAETALPDRQAATGRRFVVVSAAIENLGQAAAPFDGGSAQIVAGDGTVYRPLPGQPNALATGSLAPGRKVSGQIVFDVPRRRDLTFRYGGVDLDLGPALP